jgi:hypothetical protein
MYLDDLLVSVKVKVKLTLCLTEHHAMKAYLRSGGIDPRILDLCTRWSWVVSFTPRLLYSQVKSPSTHWIGGWVGPKAYLDTVVKGKIPSPCRDSNPWSSSPYTYPALYHWAIPSPPSVCGEKTGLDHVLLWLTTSLQCLFFKHFLASSRFWNIGARVVFISRTQWILRSHYRSPPLTPPPPPPRWVPPSSHYHIFVTRLCDEGKGLPSSSFACFTELLVPSPVFRELKLITKTQPIPLFRNTAKATMRCVKRFWNENLQVKCGWWLLSSSLFTIRYLWRPLFFF